MRACTGILWPCLHFFLRALLCCSNSKVVRMRMTPAREHLQCQSIVCNWARKGHAEFSFLRVAALAWGPAIGIGTACAPRSGIRRVRGQATRDSPKQDAPVYQYAFFGLCLVTLTSLFECPSKGVPVCLVSHAFFNSLQPNIPMVPTYTRHWHHADHRCSSAPDHDSP